MLEAHEKEIKNEKARVARVKIQSQALEIQHSVLAEKLENESKEVLALKTENNITIERLNNERKEKEKLLKQADKDKKRLNETKDKLKEAETDLKTAEKKEDNTLIINELELEKEKLK